MPASSYEPQPCKVAKVTKCHAFYFPFYLVATLERNKCARKLLWEIENLVHDK